MKQLKNLNSLILPEAQDVSVVKTEKSYFEKCVIINMSKKL